MPTAVPGYRLVRWTGACPDGLLASYADARAAINDAPHADDESWSPERVRDLEAVVARRGAAPPPEGLATWMKADALATLRLERPDVAFVTTSNAYENYSIRAINQRLGFISTVVWVTAVLAV